jgi:hypothetical protein
MSQFCYVVMNNAGHSWPALSAAEAEPSMNGNNASVLPQLLQEGWVPVRETPMGGGTSLLAHSLILLEKQSPKAPRGRKAK